MKRLPNVREVMNIVRTTVSNSQMEKEAAARPEAHMTVDIAQDLAKVAREIRDGSFAPVTYNEVMNFASQVKEAVER